MAGWAVSTAAGLGSATLGVAVPVGVRVSVHRLPVRLVSTGQGSAWRSAALAGWVAGLGGGAAGRGVRRILLCGARRSWGVVGAAGVCASTPAGWRGRVCARGWAWSDVPQAPAFSSHLLEGLLQAPEDIRVVLGRGEVAGLDSLGVERIGQHGFQCGLWHLPLRLEAAVLHRPLAGPVDQALQGRLYRGPLSQLPELRVGPALPPLSLGAAMALGAGVGAGGCGGVVGTGGGGRPGGVLLGLWPRGAWGAGAWADMDPRVRAHGLLLGVGLGFAVAALAGHLLDVGWYLGLVGGQGLCWWALALFLSGQGWSVGCGL